MRVKQPLTNNSINEAVQDQAWQGRRRTLNLDLAYRTTAQIEILPGRDNYDQEMIQVWVKGRIHNLPFTRGLVSGSTNTEWRIDTSTTGINTTTMIGGRIDGLALQASTYYNIWLLMNNSNTGLLGYAITRQPQAAFTAISTGAKDGLAVLTLAGTGLNNAFQFSVGARVLIRTGSGTTPNFNFNWGIVTAISANNSMTVRLDNRTQDGSTTITVAGTSEIIQFDTFKPISDPTVGTLYTNNYRLIGELCTDASSNIVFVRRADDPYRILNFVYPQTNVASGTTTYRAFRYIPYWAKELRIDMTANKTLSGAVARIRLTVPNRLAQVIEVMPIWSGASTGNRVDGARIHVAGAGEFSTQSESLAGGGDVNITPTISGYWDGGLRE